MELSGTLMQSVTAAKAARQGSSVKAVQWRGPHYGEVPAIQRGYLGDVQPFRQRDHRDVGRVQPGVVVGVSELSQMEFLVGDIDADTFQESRMGGCPHADVEQPARLDHHG